MGNSHTFYFCWTCVVIYSKDGTQNRPPNRARRSGRRKPRAVLHFRRGDRNWQICRHPTRHTQDQRGKICRQDHQVRRRRLEVPHCRAGFHERPWNGTRWTCQAPRGLLVQEIPDPNHGVRRWSHPSRYVCGRHTLNEDVVASYIKQLCEVLEHLHQKNAVHLDLRPTNIRFNSSNILKLVDYSTCKFIANKKAGAVVDVLGDTEFCPPEMLSYEPVSPGSDMWAVAVNAYILLSG